MVRISRMSSDTYPCVTPISRARLPGVKAVVGTKSEIEGDGFGLSVEDGLEFTE